MNFAPTPSDGAAIPRRPLLRRRIILHALGVVAAGLVTWVVWRGYSQPGLLIDLANAMLWC